MSQVKGENFIAKINDSGTWKGYMCARSISLSLNTEFIETSVTGNGLFATYAPTKNSFTGSGDGIVTLNEPGSLTLEDLQEKQMAQEICQMQFERTDGSGNTYTQIGYFFITNSQDSGSYDGLDLFSITFQGTGRLSRVFRFEYTAVTGLEISFTDASLIDRSILKVDRGGVDYTVILTGTPTPDEVLYDPATGTFTFITTFSAGEEAFVLYY